MNIEDKVVIITGGVGGLGSHTATAFARAAARVAVVDLNREEDGRTLLQSLRNVGCADCLAVDADVSGAAGIASTVDKVLSEWGRIDVLVNAAAITTLISLQDIDALTEEVWELILKTNLSGPYLFSRAVAPIMRSQGDGRIINVTSVAAFTPTGSSVAYAVAKAGLAHLTRCLAVALAPEVLVNSVAPGLMETTGLGRKLTAEQVKTYTDRTALKRSVTIDDVAAQIVAFAKSDSTTGQNLVVDCGSYFH